MGVEGAENSNVERGISRGVGVGVGVYIAEEADNPGVYIVGESANCGDAAEPGV